MNVLLVIHTPRDPHSAVFCHAEDRVAQLRRSGHVATLFSPEDVPWLARRGERWRQLFFPVALAMKLLRQQGQLDIVVFHSVSAWFYALCRGLQRRTRPRIVIQFHGLEPLYHRAAATFHRQRGPALGMMYRVFHFVFLPAVLKFSCRHADLVLCLNAAEARFLVEEAWASREVIQVAANSVPREFFIERQYAQRAQSILFIGQWLENKGTATLAGAFNLLARRWPRLKLRCVGTRLPTEQVLASFDAAVQGQVVVVPVTSREGVRAELAAADVFVLPTYFEGSSVALLEAAASALPIVTTAVGAAPDWLVDGESVSFIRAGDSRSLVAAIERLIDSPEERERQGKAAQAAARHFESEAVLRDFVEHMSELAGGQHQSQR